MYKELLKELDDRVRDMAVDQAYNVIQDAISKHNNQTQQMYGEVMGNSKPYFKETIPKILKGYLPKQKKSFGKRFKDFNKNMADYFKERPLLFAVLLLFGSQATSVALGNSGSLDMPPDFPF